MIGIGRMMKISQIMKRMILLRYLNKMKLYYEVYKVIPRLYKVSQDGEVFKVHKGYMKRLNPYLFNIGIPSVSLKCKDGKFRFFKLSRLVAFAYVNNPKNYPTMQVICIGVLINGICNRLLWTKDFAINFPIWIDI